MKLSIIIPIYNIEAYLAECIDSIVNQIDNKEVEIILINDGSTDNCKSICEEYVKKHQNILLINQSNRGQGFARNLGLEIAKGEFVWFIDGDDWIIDNTINTILENLNNFDIEMLEFSFQFYYQKTKKFASSLYGEKNIETTNGIDFIKKNERVLIPVWLYIYKKSFLKTNKIIFNEETFSEDEKFNWDCFCYVNKIKKIDLIVVNYRIRPNSLINSNVYEKRIKSSIFILDYFQNLKKINYFGLIDIENKIYNNLNQFFSFLIKSNLSLNSKIEYLKKVKKIIPKIQPFESEREIVSLEKKIYNFNVYLFYFYKLFRNYIR